MPDITPQPITPRQAKRLLKSKGWSYRRAAPLLGVSYQHLSEVLNRGRKSRRVLKAIEALPRSTTRP